jgi:hypothetical protein
VDVPEKQCFHPRTRADVTEAVAVGALAAMLLFLRVPEAPRNFWAEDGNVFFQDARSRSFVPTFFRPHQGYYHFVPRTIGGISALVPLRSAAAVTFALVALVVGWCAATTFLASRPWVQTHAGRVCLAIALVALPVLGVESIANAANLQYTMLFVAGLVLLSEGTSRALNINGAIFVVVTGLSCPVLVVLAPLVVWRVARRRAIRPDLITWAWIAGTAAHLLPVAIIRPPRGSATVSLGVIMRGFASDVVRYDFAGGHGPILGAAVILLLSMVVFGGIAFSVQRGSRSRAALLFGVPALGVLVYVVSASTQAAASSQQDPLHVSTRKDVFPALCLTWAVIVAAESLIVAFEIRRQARELLATSVLVLLLVVWLAHWTPPRSRTSGTTWNASLDRAKQECALSSRKYATIPILPQGKITTWFVHIRCSDIR